MSMQLKTLTLDPPPGLSYFPSLAPPQKSHKFHQFLVLFLTFIAYASFHASRKPPSIVKSVLTHEIPSNGTVNATAESNSDQNLFEFAGKRFINGTGWAPFDGPRGSHRLGELDLSFLLAYAIGMFVSGHIGDSVDLRIFLTIGMVGSGIFVIIFGLGYFIDLHSFSIFLLIQVVCGLFQSVGWPCVVSVVGNWFGKGKRGLIMGIWNSHTSVGNIIGSLVASSVLGLGWGWSFVVPGTLIIFVAIFIYLFLAVNPENIGFMLPNEETEMCVEGMSLVDSVEAGIDDGIRGPQDEHSAAISFFEAWRLPHVASFAFCLFFSKLVAYTFLYWLPFYIRHTGDIELLTFLLAKGVDVDLQSDAGTPLIWAAGHAQIDAVKVLLEHNANPNIGTEDDITPLLSAVAAGSFTCLDLLIKAGTNVNVSAGGATPLHIAADNGNPEIINCLLQAGANPNATDENGLRPIQIAASRGTRIAVEILFPVTSKFVDNLEWSVDAIIDLMHCETGRKEDKKEGSEDFIKVKDDVPSKQDIPKVTPEAKKQAAEAKARADDAFRRKDYMIAIDAYTQAIDFDLTDATLVSNRSLCWIRLGQPEQALADAKACRGLRPDWPKACYREGAALRLMQKFEEAANAFYEGVVLDPENKELVTAFREAVEAGRKFHGVQQPKS